MASQPQDTPRQLFSREDQLRDLYGHPSDELVIIVGDDCVGLDQPPRPMPTVMGMHLTMPPSAAIQRERIRLAKVKADRKAAKFRRDFQRTWCNWHPLLAFHNMLL